MYINDAKIIDVFLIVKNNIMNIYPSHETLRHISVFSMVYLKYQLDVTLNRYG